MSSAEHERLLRRARAQDAALFRYRLIGPALEEALRLGLVSDDGAVRVDVGLLAFAEVDAFQGPRVGGERIVVEDLALV